MRHTCCTTERADGADVGGGDQVVCEDRGGAHQEGRIRPGDQELGKVADRTPHARHPRQAERGEPRTLDRAQLELTPIRRRKRQSRRANGSPTSTRSWVTRLGRKATRRSSLATLRARSSTTPNRSSGTRPTPGRTPTVPPPTRSCSPCPRRSRIPTRPSPPTPSSSRATSARASPCSP